MAMLAPKLMAIPPRDPSDRKAPAVAIQRIEITEA